MVRIVALVLTLLATAAMAQTDSSADYPNKTVRIVVAGAPGGGVDTVARIVAQHLRQKFGQPFVIENRDGASGNVGADVVFHSKPDAYTLLASSLSPITINHLLYRNINFEPAAFEPVALMSRIPNVLVVRQDFPAKSAGELVALLKANTGKMSYASNGPGTAGHLTAELFMQITGTKLLHVPYKGTAPLLTDLTAGRVDMTFAQVAAVHPHYRAGKVKILATATNQRFDFMPEIPTLAETGVLGTESETGNAISAPPKTPASIIGKLNTGVNEALNTTEVKALFTKLYLLPGAGNPVEVRKFINDYAARWAKVIQATGLKAE